MSLESGFRLKDPRDVDGRPLTAACDIGVTVVVFDGIFSAFVVIHGGWGAVVDAFSVGLTAAVVDTNLPATSALDIFDRLAGCCPVM